MAVWKNSPKQMDSGGEILLLRLNIIYFLSIIMVGFLC